MEPRERGMRRCTVCAGVWMAKAQLDHTIAGWQHGASAWWQAELRCPEPHAQPQLLTPRARDGVTLHVCDDHGAWFDRGRLAKVLGLPDGESPDAPGGDELAGLEREVAGHRNEIAYHRGEITRLTDKVAVAELRIAELRARRR